jgi:hypothetical protein
MVTEHVPMKSNQGEDAMIGLSLDDKREIGLGSGALRRHDWKAWCTEVGAADASGRQEL